MLNVEDRVRQLQLNHVYKIFNGDCPNYMSQNFYRIRDMQRISTRASAYNYFVPRVEGEASKTFFYNAIKYWNSLPDNIKLMENENSFKEKVKLHIRREAREKEQSLFV